MTDFITLDSGDHQEFDSGMMRETQEGKPRFDLMLPLGVPYDEQMLTRFAQLLERGARKYSERNWEKASGVEELDRARAGAFRHFMQWMCGETSEDHAAAVWFNIMEAEYVRWRMWQEAERGAEDPIEVGDVLHSSAQLDSLGTGAIVQVGSGFNYRMFGVFHVGVWERVDEAVATFRTNSTNLLSMAEPYGVTVVYLG